MLIVLPAHSERNSANHIRNKTKAKLNYHKSGIFPSTTLYEVKFLPHKEKKYI